MDLPERASQFISDYDAGHNPKPFSFTLDLPDDILKHPKHRNV